MNIPTLIIFLSNLCTSLHGPDSFDKRNYEHYACVDQIKRCVMKPQYDSQEPYKAELSTCIGKYVKKNYRKRR